MAIQTYYIGRYKRDDRLGWAPGAGRISVTVPASWLPVPQYGTQKVYVRSPLRPYLTVAAAQLSDCFPPCDQSHQLGRTPAGGPTSTDGTVGCATPPTALHQ